MKHLTSNELRQKNSMSPLQYQSLRILQMNLQELSIMVNGELLENPVLEQKEAAGESIYTSLSQEGENQPPVIEGGVYITDNDSPYDRTQKKDSYEKLNAADRGVTLEDYLKSQFSLSLYENEVNLLNSILNYIGKNGFLTAGAAQIAEEIGAPKEYVEYGIAYLQKLDPVGSCSEDLEDCLLIQLETMGYNEEIFKLLVCNHLPDIAAGKYKKISSMLSLSEDDIKEACLIIKSLNPKPGACFGISDSNYIRPDISIVIENGETEITLDSRYLPSLHISGYYKKMYESAADPDASKYLENKINRAIWLISAIEKRGETLLKLGEFIFDIQRGFFLEGNPLSTLTLKETAQRLDMHTSTVSRAIAGKYLQCSRGIFPLKYFFASAAGKKRKNTVSRPGVKERIASIISSECPEKPYSDSHIAQILSEGGINISRRVIAKYRMEMSIPPSSARKKN